MNYDSVSREEFRVAWEIVDQAVDDMKALMLDVQIEESRMRKHLMNRLLWTAGGREVLWGVMRAGGS